MATYEVSKGDFLDQFPRRPEDSTVEQALTSHQFNVRKLRDLNGNLNELGQIFQSPPESLVFQVRLERYLENEFFKGRQLTYTTTRIWVVRLGDLIVFLKREDLIQILFKIIQDAIRFEDEQSAVNLERAVQRLIQLGTTVESLHEMVDQYAVKSVQES